MVIWDPILNESDTSDPMSSAWLLAEVNWSRPFSITTDSPNVTSSVVSTLRFSAACSSVRCMMYPSPAKIGTTRTNDQTAGTCVTAMTPSATYPATTARSPCARLMTFITPNSSDSPHANSA